MKTYKVQVPYLAELPMALQIQTAGSLIPLVSGVLKSFRLYSLVVPASIEQLAAARRRKQHALPELWQRRYLAQEIEMLNLFNQERDKMKTAEHYLVDFEADVSETVLSGYGYISATAKNPPIPLQGTYQERPDHMYPIQAGSKRRDNTRYAFSCISSYLLTRTWGIHDPLKTILIESDGPLIMVVDVKRVPDEALIKSANLWETAIQSATTRDPKAHIAREEVELALTLKNQAIHHMRVLFFLLDKDTDRLLQRRRDFLQSAERFMSPQPLVGYQQKAFQYLTPNPNPKGLPDGYFNTPSKIVASSMTGLLSVNDYQKTRGVLWGVTEGNTRTLFEYHHWKGDAETGYSADHGFAMGLTGKGKTVWVLAQAGRHVAQGDMVIMLEPMGHSQRLGLLLDKDDEGVPIVRHNRFTSQTRLNLLDVVMPTKKEQYAHVRKLLGFALALDKAEPYDLSIHETIAMQAALDATYAGLTLDELLGKPEITPVLSQFVSHLHELDKTQRFPSEVVLAGKQLAQNLAGLHLRDGLETTFSGQSNIHVNLSYRANLFDFSAIRNPNEQGVYYYALLTAIFAKIMNSDGQKRGRLFVDEVYRMSMIPGLIEFLALLIKTVRTKGWSVVLIDQDIDTLLKAGETGEMILQNISWLVSFGLSARAVEKLAHERPEMQPHHKTWLIEKGRDDPEGLHRDKGYFLAFHEGKVRPMYAALTAHEYHCLIGS